MSSQFGIVAVPCRACVSGTYTDVTGVYVRTSKTAQESSDVTFNAVGDQVEFIARPRWCDMTDPDRELWRMLRDSPSKVSMSADVTPVIVTEQCPQCFGDGSYEIEYFGCKIF